jgi:D-ala D-ala ligase C-terminus
LGDPKRLEPAATLTVVRPAAMPEARVAPLPTPEPAPEWLSESIAAVPMRQGVAGGDVHFERDPAVLFVDECVVVPFVQLAVMLRRAGYRTIRVTTRRSRIESARLHRVAYDRVLRVSRPDLARLGQILCTEQIVDVQCVEGLAVETYRGLSDSALVPPAFAWHGRMAVLDKMALGEQLDLLGVLRPPSVAGDTPTEVIATKLGLPVVMKPRVGSSGVGISILETFGELECAVESIVDPSAVFFERHIAGERVNYCAVVGPDGSERDMTYVTVESGPQVGSPSLRISCEQDAGLIQIGRRVAAVLPTQGLLNLDAIRDAEGRYWCHDVNLRVWGGFFAPRRTGLDLSSAYLRWLSDHTRATSPEAESEVRLFPGHLINAVRSGRVRGLLGSAHEDAANVRRRLGGRYVAYELSRLVRRGLGPGWFNRGER